MSNEAVQNDVSRDPREDVSDTPRTDAAWKAADGRGILAEVNGLDALCRELEREVAELLYVVEKAAEWDADNTDNTDLAALGAYARAALSKCHAQDSHEDAR